MSEIKCPFCGGLGWSPRFDGNWYCPACGTVKVGELAGSGNFVLPEPACEFVETNISAFREIRAKYPLVADKISPEFFEGEGEEVYQSERYMYWCDACKMDFACDWVDENEALYEHLRDDHPEIIERAVAWGTMGVL